MPTIKEAVQNGRTLYEVQRTLGLERDEARDLLDRLDLLDLVHSRVTHIDNPPDPADIEDRIRAATTDAP
ncbi:hypothetical protein BRD00_13515 [Halobacteriales archaeon QS_8_69_26]|nr:MAG: hypothetical protein BRD00_13515 [Halobacteriales archaeon QS_8_69_26]